MSLQKRNAALEQVNCTVTQSLAVTHTCCCGGNYGYYHLQFEKICNNALIKEANKHKLQMQCLDLMILW